MLTGEVYTQPQFSECLVRISGAQEVRLGSLGPFQCGKKTICAYQVRLLVSRVWCMNSRAPGVQGVSTRPSVVCKALPSGHTLAPPE